VDSPWSVGGTGSAHPVHEKKTHTKQRGMKRVAKKSRFLRVACDSFFSFFTASYRACVRFFVSEFRAVSLFPARAFAPSHFSFAVSSFIPFARLTQSKRSPFFFHFRGCSLSIVSCPPSFFSSPALRATHTDRMPSLSLLLLLRCARRIVSSSFFLL
jgi:hypothetical protein